MPDERDILVRIALTEQAFSDITKRLDKIEQNLESIKQTTNMGMGAWKAIFFVGATLSSIWAFLRITKT